SLYLPYTLTTGGVQSATPSQSIGSYFVRGGLEPTRRLRLTAGAYLATYTTFGSSLDGRFSVSYDLDPSSVARFSIGTGFRAPLLVERYVFPDSALIEDANCVFLGQGNPHERPEHATEYELGYAHKFTSASLLDVSVYRTNLRDPIETFYPLANQCPHVAYSFPINIGNVVYQGGAVEYQVREGDVTLNLQYGINIAYPFNLPAAVSNPTSGGTLVNGQQFLNIPQQVGSAAANWNRGVWHAGIEAMFRGKNNELNQGPYTLVDGSVGHAFGRSDLTLSLANVGSDVSGKFTQLGGGVPYLGNGPNGTLVPLPTNRYVIEPIGARLIFTVR
ncbi:MAG: TonB-dependent receptor, partial [Candidatus Eremiobacteraeota bacterium]|nr:TonB-dependent receptor [Candidatus Eremiobacteraeota bacterium]